MIDIAISNCPNDTFVFDAWIHGKSTASVRPKVQFHDIQELNHIAQKRQIDVIKVSAFAYGRLTNHYKLLPTGAAIGPYGPKVIAKKPFHLDELSEKTVAVPGFDTTAYLLLKTLCPKVKQCITSRYDTCLNLVESGQADACVIIHETRFTYQLKGFVEICDLGSLFYDRYRLPVPLGVVIIRNDCNYHDETIDAMRNSLDFAKNNPDSAYDFMHKHSHEKDREVILAHKTAYVTAETYNISKQGLQAIQTLLKLAQTHTLLEQEPLNFDEAFSLCNR